MKFTMQSPDFLFFEQDGSLSTGYEIITAPFSSAWWNENRGGFETILTYLKGHKYRSHNTSTCGLHVHVGRCAFQNGEMPQGYELWDEARRENWYIDSENNIAKLILITERFWDTLVKLSRRKIHALNEWAWRYETTNHENIKSIAKSKRGLGKYRAINLTNYETIEFRIFRGTLNFLTLCATLDLVDALIATAREETVERIYSARKLSALIGKKRMTPAMTAYFKARGI
jgi:hypothetical protein